MDNFKRILFLGTLLVSIFFIQGCALVADIFSAGFWIGIVIAVLVLVLIVWLIIKGRKWMRK